MDYSPLVAAGGSLVGAALGASAVLGSQMLQWRRERKAGIERSRQQAVEELLVQAESIDLASHFMVTIAQEFTSLSGQLNRLLRISTAFDLANLIANLSRHADALNRAAAQIWMTADQETVRRTNAVVLAAMDLVSAQSAVQPATWRHARRLLQGMELADESVVAAARQKLANARRDLVEHTRRQFGLPHVDLFALPANFDEADRPPDAPTEPARYL